MTPVCFRGPCSKVRPPWTARVPVPSCASSDPWDARPRVEQVGEADAQSLVPIGVGVRQVVRDGVELLLLGLHAGGSGSESFEHLFLNRQLDGV